MHNGRGCPGAQNRLIHSSLPHLLPSGSPETLLGLDVVKAHINPNVSWLCWPQSRRHQEEGGNSHFSLQGEWLGMALAYPDFPGSSWDLEGGDSLGPLVPWPPGRFQVICPVLCAEEAGLEGKHRAGTVGRGTPKIRKN